MLGKKIFTRKIAIEKLETTLSNDNRWIEEYVFWKEIWASITLKNFTAQQSVYLFVVNWRPDFPYKFRVKMNEKFFMPTQSAVANIPENTILFHAVLEQ